MAAAVRHLRTDILRQITAGLLRQPQPFDYNLREVCFELQSVVTGLDGGQPLSEGQSMFASFNDPCGDSAGAAILLVPEIASWAQTAADGRQVDLVRQDQSDCTNTTDPANPPVISGTVSLNRDSDGNTSVKVAMTVSPDTTYHFFLKCVRQLGDITTGDEGTGFGKFYVPNQRSRRRLWFRHVSGGAAARKQVSERHGQVLTIKAGETGPRSPIPLTR